MFNKQFSKNWEIRSVHKKKLDKERIFHRQKFDEEKNHFREYSILLLGIIFGIISNLLTGIIDNYFSNSNAIYNRYYIITIISIECIVILLICFVMTKSKIISEYHRWIHNQKLYFSLGKDTMVKFIEAKPKKK